MLISPRPKSAANLCSNACAACGAGYSRPISPGKPKIPAYLEDYAYLSEGFLALFTATHEPRWQEAARALIDQQIRLFWDEQSKGFYFTSKDHEDLIARNRN